MKIQKIKICILVFVMVYFCTGCGAQITMPYGSTEYKELGWSIDELVEHFHDLGFENVTTDVMDTFDENEVRIFRVNIEDVWSDSLFTDYKAFEKEESFSSTLKILVSGYRYIPTLTVDNCPEFAEIVTNDMDENEREEQYNKFLSEHGGEYLEFNGTITNWEDEYFWVGIWFDVSIEDSDRLVISWEDVDLIEMDMDGEYHYENYHEGVITEGMRVHMRVKIINREEGTELKVATMEIIE